MLKPSFYHLRQFLFAMSATMNALDWHFVNRYLNPVELALFKQLPEFEQKHSVVVAQKMQEMIEGRVDVNTRLAAKIGLLHDIGKVPEHLSIFSKGMITLVRIFVRPLYEYLAAKGEKSRPRGLLRKFYIHRHHGAVGAEMLEQIGADREVLICCRLHDFPEKYDSMYMKLLRKADTTY
jgi:putative nucleotidyltransferase with HDIG domain